MFRDSLNSYQCTIKAERAKYVSKIITKNSGDPKFLFNTVNSVLHPSTTAISETTSHSGEDFQRFFTEKLDNLRAHILLPSQDPSEPLICSSFLTHFKPVSLFPLTDIIMHTKPTTCYLDVLPTPSLSCHFCLRFWRKSSSTNCPHFSGFWINVSLVSELSTAHSLLY